MKRNFTEFLRKCQFSPLLTFGTLPVVLIVMVLFQPQELDIVWLFPFAYILLSTAALLLPGRLRIWFGCTGILLLIAMAFLLGGGMLWLVALGYAAMLVFGLVVAGWPWEREFPIGCIVTCILFHGIAQVLVMWTQGNQSQVLAPVSGWFAPAFLVFALLSMLSFNRNTLALATLGRRKPSQFVRRRNTSAIVVLFLTVLAISLIPAIGDILGALWNWLVSLIASLIPAGQNPVESTAAENTTVPAEPPIIDDAPTSNWFSVFLHVFSKFLMIFIPFSIIALVVIVLVLLIRKLSTLLRSLFDAINADEDSELTDYTDEIYDLRGSQPKRLAFAKNILDNAPWNTRNLSPRQQIRSRYRHLLKKHPQWQPSHTAREQLPDGLAAYYERARYTDQELTVEDADAFADGVKGL